MGCDRGKHARSVVVVVVVLVVVGVVVVVVVGGGVVVVVVVGVVCSCRFGDHGSSWVHGQVHSWKMFSTHPDAMCSTQSTSNTFNTETSDQLQWLKGLSNVLHCILLPNKH